MKEERGAYFERIAKRVLTEIKKMRRRGRAAPFSVEVALVPPRTLRQLKWRFLKKKAKTVDVLAFPETRSFPHPERRGIFLGEVCLNRAIAGRDPARGAYLLVHGILHLLGCRHGRERDTIRMKRLEKRLVERLGYSRETWDRVSS